ncbi:nitronate monooxygenase [Paracoccus sp. S-4012]|uniref:NAD(P)H-dependent flavin oxidoreductase n=1 Tax=Paracoccus sp. S-4012 TaxID=2665648 RepID=UPI0012AFAB27|nr:nitronate monooxygenase [Paracoccus sp. S-4012]MRX50914.1 nitronate monooxygenase [Paracoccus sp. S-4012]
MPDLHPLPARLGLRLPILQAPMAGTASPPLAAAATEAGGLGALGLAAMTPVRAAEEIAATRALTGGPINANFFCHRQAPSDPQRDARWLARLAPEFARLGVTPPEQLQAIFPTFRGNAALLDVVLDTRPEVLSLHFGLPEPETVTRLKAEGIVLIATATSLVEGRAVEAAGFDAVVAQGWEAGGHRGLFDEDGPDARLGSLALTRLLARSLSIPVIAAGGIMDGAGIAAVERLGAAAAQMGTAFVACPESRADDGYRAALAEAADTVMTRAISGRPARGLANRFTALGDGLPRAEISAYPYAYDAGKALIAAAKARGEAGFGAHWAGQGAPLARALPAAELMARLAEERAAA